MTDDLETLYASLGTGVLTGLVETYFINNSSDMQHELYTQ